MGRLDDPLEDRACPTPDPLPASQDRACLHCHPYQCSSADGTSGPCEESGYRRLDRGLPGDQEVQRAPRERGQGWRSQVGCCQPCHTPSLPYHNPVGPLSYNCLDPGGARTVGYRLHELGQVPGAIERVLGSPLLQCLFTIQEEQLQGHRGCLWELVVRASLVSSLALTHPPFPACLHS